MAAIEKVCEFSGDYPGWIMHKYKRNHIQIMPEYRKEFRGHKAVLYVFKRKLVLDMGFAIGDADLNCINPNPTEYDWNNYNADTVVRYQNGIKSIWSVFYNNMEEYKAAMKKRHWRVLMQYEYVLHVPSLQGDVDGLYVNWSTDMSSVVRRLRRLVGTRNLTVKRKEGEAWDYMLEHLLSNGE